MDTIITLVLYLVVCYASGKIGAKCRIGTLPQYFIPIYGLVLTYRCARVSPWWVAAMFIPFVNMAACVYVYGKLAERLGKNFWSFGLGMFALGIPMFIMAFDDSQPLDAPPPLTISGNYR
ncbi:MAG TPA: DUF5684 domain-containing protein [Patescibacteria group bacterium]|nr:DUF5684 domain-containing protein [Patescibacteria group bacterium]